MSGVDRRSGRTPRRIARALSFLRLPVPRGLGALVAASALTIGLAPAFAQPVDPFGAAPPAGAGDPAGIDPFGSGAPVAPAPAAPGATAPAAAPIGENDPAVLSILESNPRTPVAKVRAAQALLSLGRPELAKRFLGEVVASLDGQAAFDVTTQFGAGFFLDLGSREDIAPAGRAFVDAVYSKYAEFARDPANVQTALIDVAGDSLADRERGLRVIAGAGEAAVGPIAAALAEPNDSAAARGAMIAFGEFPWLPPTIPALLDSGDPVLVTRAIELLTTRGEHERHIRTLGFLRHSDPRVRAAAETFYRDRVGDVPESRLGANLLAAETQRYLGGMTPAYVAQISEVPRPVSRYWVWDEATKQPVLVTGRPLGPSMQAAAQLSAATLALAPDDDAARTDYLLAQFADRGERFGPVDVPDDVIAAWEDRVAITPERLLAVARRALEYDLPGALAVTLQIAGTRDYEEVLASGGAERPLVAEALRHASPDVRFAAALAVARIAPDYGFREASRVLEVLGNYARPVEAPAICVGHPRSAVATTYATLIEQSGFETFAATSPDDLFRECRRRAAHLYAIVLHERLLNRTLVETVSMFRKDPATADVPIIVLSETPDDPRYRFVVSDFENVRIVDQALAPGAFRMLADEFEPGVDAALARTRRPQTALALDAIEKLIAVPGNPLDLVWARVEEPVTEALRDPEFAPAAAQILARIGSAEAQTALVDTATQSYLPVAAREAIVEAFADATKQKGIMLTRDQILRQYDRYNESRTLDVDTQRIRSAILDVLESRIPNDAAPIAIEAPAAELSSEPAPAAGEPAPASVAEPEASTSPAP